MENTPFFFLCFWNKTGKNKDGKGCTDLIDVANECSNDWTKARNSHRVWVQDRTITGFGTPKCTVRSHFYGHAHAVASCCCFALWRGAWFGFHYRWCVRLVCAEDRGGQWYGHDAKCLGLKKLHGSSNVFFHQLSHLLFSSIIWPFLPGRLGSTFYAISLFTER